MELKLFCQSCTLPIDSLENRGTEKDGSKSECYCRHCYQNGEFTNPDMTLEEMKKIIVHQMKKMDLPDVLITQSLHMLPHLKRWNKFAEPAGNLL